MLLTQLNESNSTIGAKKLLIVVAFLINDNRERSEIE